MLQGDFLRDFRSLQMNQEHFRSMLSLLFIRIQLKKSYLVIQFAIEIPITQQSLYSKMVSSITKSRLCLFNDQSSLLISDSVPISLESSGSFILSLAQFLSKVAEIYPQSVMTSNSQNTEINQSKEHEKRQPEHYLQIWCDYLFSLLSSDNIMQMKEECILFAKVSNDYMQYCLNTRFFNEVPRAIEESDVKKIIATQVYKQSWQQTPEEEKKKVLIINLSQSVTNTDKTRAKINIDGLFSGILYRNGDLWKSYKILLKQIPSIQELVEANTVFISGSTFSVNNKHQYMTIFIDNLMEALKINKKLKVSGICFGHQLVAQAYGARVEKRDLIRGPEWISSPEAHNLGQVSYLSELSNGESFKTKNYEFHSDYVVNVPQGFVCIGSSETCQNQIFISSDKRIFTFQFHPQYLVEYIRSIEKRWQSDNTLFKGIHQDNYKYEQQNHKTNAIFRRAIRKFIDWKVQTF